METELFTLHLTFRALSDEDTDEALDEDLDDLEGDDDDDEVGDADKDEAASDGAGETER